MGLYRRHIAPHLINYACGAEPVDKERGGLVPEAEGVVIEVGVGGGRNLPHYDPARVKRIIGANPADGFLRFSERAADDALLPVEVIAAPAENLPLEDASADTAVLTFTLCSVDDALKSLSELRRVLKPSGRMIVIEHGRSDEPRVARWQDRINPIWRAIGAGCNINRDVRALLLKSGFTTDTLKTHYMPDTPKPMGFITCGIVEKT